MREYELRIAQKMSMKVSDLFLNNRERNTVSAKVLAAWLEIKPKFASFSFQNMFIYGIVQAEGMMLW